jgi:hypothetical protein
MKPTRAGGLHVGQPKWLESNTVKQTIFRGTAITDQQVLEAFDRFDRELRATFPKRQWVTYAVEHNGRLYPPKTIIRLITGGRTPGGGKPVNSRFEDLGFKIVVIDEPPDPTVASAETNDEDVEVALSLEYDLENSLAANLGQLEAGLTLYRENGLLGQQLDAKTAGRIDLLAVDSNGNLVVIELKAIEADRQVAGQIQAYMGWVTENLAKGRQVRGIIVASDFTQRLVYAAKVVPNLSLKRYQIIFKFLDP